MESKQLFEETIKIEQEIIKLQELMSKLYSKYSENMDVCKHSLVFKYIDNIPRKMHFDGNYYCPACGKILKCMDKNEINNSVFKDSKIVSLMNLSLIGTNEVLNAIRNEVYKNIDLYYGDNISVDELSSMMEKFLKDNQYEYTKKYKVLRK